MNMNAAMELGTSELKAYRAMLDGVAFKTDRNNYDVISHEGDYIDSFTVLEIEPVVAKLKKLGLNPTVFHTSRTGRFLCPLPAFTFAY